MWIQPLGSTISSCCRDQNSRLRSAESDGRRSSDFTGRYPDLLQVVEVVAHSDGDLTGGVALVRFVVGVDAKHLHGGPPPGFTTPTSEVKSRRPQRSPNDPRGSTHT